MTTPTIPLSPPDRAAEVDRLRVALEKVAPTNPAGSRRRKLLLVMADVAALSVATAVSMAVARQVGAVKTGAVLAAPGYTLVGFFHQRLYRARYLTRRLEEARRVTTAVMFGVIAAIVSGYVAKSEPSRPSLAAFTAAALVAIMIERELSRTWFRSLRRSGRMRRRVLVVGANAEGRQLAAQFRDDFSLGYEVVGLVMAGNEGLVVTDTPVIGHVRELRQLVEELDVTTVVLAASALELDQAKTAVRDLINAGIHVELSPGLVDVSPDRLTVQRVGRFPIVYVEPCHQGGWRAIAKRTFDIVVSVTGLVVTSPLVIVTAIAIKLDSPGPVFFSQQRVGRSGELFQLYKLRTMVEDAEELRSALLAANESDGPLFKIHNDPRVTRIGRRLRQLSIDEIPQLWNVLKGEMSLVGPRPALPEESEQWSAELWERVRVQPGLTGVWQVNGRSYASFDDYIRHDLYYVDNWSLLGDLGVMLKTVPAVVRRHGAH